MWCANYHREHSRRYPGLLDIAGAPGWMDGLPSPEAHHDKTMLKFSLLFVAKFSLSFMNGCVSMRRYDVLFRCVLQDAQAW